MYLNMLGIKDEGGECLEKPGKGGETELHHGSHRFSYYP